MLETQLEKSRKLLPFFLLKVVFSSCQFDIMTDYDDKSNLQGIALLQDLNFQVSKTLNTSELWAYLITKTLIYMGPTIPDKIFGIN